MLLTKLSNFLVGLCLLLTSCAPMIPSREFQVNRFWRSAQERLAERTNGLSYEIPSSMFRWRWMDRAFKCGDVWAVGCFDSRITQAGTPLITVYEPAQIFIIEHEACHAILYALGDVEWGCHCHDLYGGGKTCKELEAEKLKNQPLPPELK